MRYHLAAQARRGDLSLLNLFNRGMWGHQSVAELASPVGHVSHYPLLTRCIRAYYFCGAIA